VIKEDDSEVEDVGILDGEGKIQGVHRVGWRGKEVCPTIEENN